MCIISLYGLNRKVKSLPYGLDIRTDEIINLALDAFSS